MSADPVASAAGAPLAFTDAGALRSIVVAFRDGLIAHREVLNALNVYPVPDGDTGTNMSLTLTSVVETMNEAESDLEATCKAIAHGSLMGARGNSGVILSQILRALSGHLAHHSDGDATAWSSALTEAALAAYGAVMRPVEGTILTVAREAADAAAHAVADGADLVTTFDAARITGGESLDRTPTLLPALADAGVVDAGGAGFLLFLDAALHVIDGRPMPAAATPPTPVVATSAHSSDAAVEKTIADLRYEVMYFLDAADDAVDGFKAAWMDIGDSIVVVGGDGLWNCHIHCDDIGAAIEAGIAVGRPHKIRVTDLLEELDHIEDFHVVAHDEPEVSLVASAPATTAVVAVAVGDGVRRIFESLGVQAVVTGGQSMNPSTEQLLQAVEQVSADQVVILPNNKNIIAVAERVDEATQRSVGVVPTRSIAEGFAALLAYDPEASLVSNVAAMSDAGGAVEAGEVCQAVRPSKSEAGEIAEGDWLGLTRRGIATVKPTLVEATCAMLDDLVGADHEIVTLIRGAQADDAVVAEVEAWLAEHRPHVEVEVHHGGQPLYPFYVGVE